MLDRLYARFDDLSVAHGVFKVREQPCCRTPQPIPSGESAERIRWVGSVPSACLVRSLPRVAVAPCDRHSTGDDAGGVTGERRVCV